MWNPRDETAAPHRTQLAALDQDRHGAFRLPAYLVHGSQQKLGHSSLEEGDTEHGEWGKEIFCSAPDSTLNLGPGSTDALALSFRPLPYLIRAPVVATFPSSVPYFKDVNFINVRINARTSSSTLLRTAWGGQRPTRPIVIILV